MSNHYYVAFSKWQLLTVTVMKSLKEGRTQNSYDILNLVNALKSIILVYLWNFLQNMLTRSMFHNRIFTILTDVS